MDEPVLRAVSLFSGCGGLDLGFKQAGFDIVLATDFDEHCAASHRVNFPGTPFFHGSIAALDQGVATELAGQDALRNVDVLIGGPPCPPFSKSRFYRTEKPRAMDDPVGEVTISGYMDTLAWLRPRAFVLENVAGLAFKVHRESLDYIMSEAKRLGYRTAYQVLNAADYGVPQVRQRTFVVGVRDGNFKWPVPTHADNSGDSPTLLPQWRTAGEVLFDLDTEANADDTGHFAGGQYNDLLKEVPPGDNYLYFTARRGHPDPKFEWRKRYWSFLLKLSPDLPSWTIQARRSNNMGPFHWRSRILRIQEIMRLQTFPDHWYLDGTVEDQWRQVGNAVPPELARALAVQVRAAVARQSGVEAA